MKRSINKYNIAAIVAFVLLVPISASAEDWSSPDPWFVYFVIGMIFLSSLVALVIIKGSLGTSKWSLADALSEEYEITAVDSTNKPIVDTSGKSVLITDMRASTSRVIALIGMIVIVLMFVGFGVFALYSFARTGYMPGSIDEIIKFLLSGVALFAPYIVNKFSNVFDSLAPKKS